MTTAPLPSAGEENFLAVCFTQGRLAAAARLLSFHTSWITGEQVKDVLADGRA